MSAIIGWAHSQFGKLEDDDLETMLARVCKQAVEDAGIGFDEVDAIYVGNFGMFEKQSFPAAFALDADPALRFKPATRVENACATGSAAVHMGLNDLASKKSRFVLVVGAEKMTSAPGSVIGDVLLNASYRKTEADTPGGFAGVFARIADLYFQRYGDQSEAMARIAAKNHANGVHNPYAQMRKDFGYEFCNTISDKNPTVIGAIRRTDCSLVSDGAAAVVMTDTETALRFPKAVHFRAAAHAQDYLPMAKRDIVAFEGCEQAWGKAHQQAGTSLDDLSFVETHDCFTIAELIEYEAMGLTPKGEGARAIAEGWTAKDGKLPVNPSGGLKSKGHPIGATGVSMHIMAAMQLTENAGDMQLQAPELAGIFNMGGAAVANYVSILERLR
ncbi:thiolase domain-containing protein [Anderseniella sp. Alg231-50]|uniref:thiolase domain-containing protein n=1 Tax=Anderseniella sp. Alg231-50 TaxID=1922226 RepID=UPI000D55CFE4